MPRNGAGIFSLDARYLVSEGDTILPSQHNPVLEDLQTDANTPRPIVAGGTGASTATTARTNLSVYSIADVDDGFTPKVATRTALKALDTATTKAVVLTEASRQKLFMWMTGDFTDSVAGDPSELAYIPADGIDPALGCWVAVTGAGASIVPVIQGGTGANDAATALDNLGGMASATYDPNAVAGDAFDMANMVEATDAKIMTAAERTKLRGYDSVSGMSAINVPAGINALRVNGYSAAGDGGAALYKSVATEPAHPGKFQSADGVWWEIAEKIVSPEMFGASGDGIAADEVAVQNASTVAAAIGATVVGSGSYRIAAPITIPSDFHFDGGKGAQFIKDFVSVDGNADAMFVNENYGVLATDGDVANISICNVLLKTADAAATSALISFVNVNGLVLDNVRTEKNSQGFAIHLSGQNIQIRGVRPTSEGPSTNIDGLHFNWVKNLTIDGIIADTEDDCIAFTADPTTWTGSGPAGAVAQDVVINNCVLRSKAGGFRIGNGIITGGETDANTVDPDLAFRRIVVSNTLIEKTDTTGSTIAFEDTRSNANAKHTDISFVNCRIRMTGAARLVNLLGNDDPSDATKTWKNYGSIEFKGCYFECGLGEIFAGASSTSVGGAFDVLRLLDCWIVRTVETGIDNSFNLRNFGAIEVRNLRFRDKLAGPRPFFLREYDRIFMSDIFYENESAGSDAAAFLAPDDPNTGALVVLEGVVVKGDIQYRVQGVSAVSIPSLYVVGGAAETTVGDISTNITFTTGQTVNPAKSLSAVTTAANFTADRKIAIQINGATYYVPVATAVW